MDWTAQQQYTNNNGPARWSVKPRQPIWGSSAISAIRTIFEYDIVTPYGIGSNVVSNTDQESLLMVAWGGIVHLSLLAPSAATLTILTDLGDGTFTEIATSPVAVAGSAKVQFFSWNIYSAFKIRGRLTGNDTFTWNASCTDY